MRGEPRSAVVSGRALRKETAAARILGMRETSGPSTTGELRSPYAQGERWSGSCRGGLRRALVHAQHVVDAVALGRDAAGGADEAVELALGEGLRRAGAGHVV